MSKAQKIALLVLPTSILLVSVLAWTGSQGSILVEGMPLFALCFALALLIQWVAFIPAFSKKTETFFDLIGSFTFLSVLGLALFLGPKPDARAILLAVLIAIWTVRLGSFLFQRIHATGFDRRFDEIKVSFWRFLVAWTLQGVWVSFSLAAALAAITSTVQAELGNFAIVGLLVWLLGFGFEVVADFQKQQFRKDPKHQGRFINTGLWSWSRHPNYFGEILLWIGIAIIALPVLAGWQLATLISPFFVAFLLVRGSGIPLLEAQADKKWGGQTDYEIYKARTSTLIPLPPKALKAPSLR